MTDTPDRTDAIARVHLWRCSGNLLGWCPLHEGSIGEDDDLCSGVRAEARALLATDDPAAVAALAATLAERHPEAVLTAGVEAGVLLDVGTSEDTQYMSGLRPREVTS